ncbi:uncharacterized protein KIAA1614 homolog isoform X2 [Hemicordylus capensis]|uniref:uncharacterized protein KIAA1614 homolog isoform X2 n=1 Tax=Hemicordylus capensis TaxID=884348 RepID=UPI0023022528|nr:uncharacterized protein KIAA1614 homolog isoform X2 [Hemicordylus capensis]
MEGKFPTERRKGLKSMKQSVRNIARPKQVPESPDDTINYSLSGPAWVPVGLSKDISWGTSVLESKVKALKEKRVSSNKQSEVAPQERTSPKKARAHKGKPAAEAIPQDAVVEPQAQIRTYLTDGLLDSTDYSHLGQEEAQGAMLESLYVNDPETLKGPKATSEHTSIGWNSPEEFRKLPGRNIVDSKGFSENMTKRVSQNGLSGAISLKDLTFIQKSFNEDCLLEARDFERNSFVHKNDTCGVVPSGRLWRAESWDSLGSCGSNASTLSLAERVERNRAMLQEMLSISVHNSHSSQELHTLHRHRKETPALRNDGPSNELLANDVDWDSGVSLPDSEGYRAFVPNQELELSPRHEQAKQLLQRARMKARTNPLRASHNILPSAPQERRAACGITAADAKNFALKDGDPHASGNLSDSSSGESSCGQQRRRGPSPSRVRFEDESARDAEVRYLERLQQRQKRVLDSVLLSLRQGPLVSKPDLSDYINGGLQHKENGIGKACWEQQSAGQAAGQLTHKSNRGRSEKGKPLMVNEEGKCSACGSYVSNVATSRNLDTRVNRSGNDVQQVCNEPQENKNLSQAKELEASQEDSRTRTLGPKGTPLWILPSRQRVYTERIRETYIGEVTCIDDVDSALDSTTDTSDSYKIDSEEAGTSNCQSLMKSHWHGGPGPDPRPFCPSEKAAINKAEGERHRHKANDGCDTSELEGWDNGPAVSRMEVANETSNCNLKGSPEVRGQVNKMSANEVEAFSRINQPIDLSQLVKKGKAQGHSKVAKAQLKQATPTVYSQQLPSHLIPGSGTDSVTRKPVETSHHTSRLTNNLSQTRQGKGPSQHLAKHMAVGYNLVNRVPAPPTTGKAHSSPMPCRRAVLTGSYKLTKPDPGHTDQANERTVCSASSNSAQHKFGLEEQSIPQSPKMLSRSQLLALSTNNCNNTLAKHQPKTSVTATVESTEQQLQDRQKMEKIPGPSSSSCGVPHVAPNALSSAAISLSLATETNFTTSTKSPSREAPPAEAQKAKPGRESTVQRKLLEIYPEPKKKHSAKKGGTAASTSSASGLKKFFATLSLSTKQRLGRFRCYSMEQICVTEPGAAVPTEESGSGTTSSPQMKKAPSLQSLRLVSPFCQPRKAASVQNLHSLLHKTDRSSLYLLEEPKDDEVVSNRKAGAQPRRSLSVEDIGSPNLVRTVGRVVEVFPDGTSQLELQRPPKGTFGFRVSSGNGRPDTGSLNMSAIPSENRRGKQRTSQSSISSPAITLH